MSHDFPISLSSTRACPWKDIRLNKLTDNYLFQSVCGVSYRLDWGWLNEKCFLNGSNSGLAARCHINTKTLIFLRCPWPPWGGITFSGGSDWYWCQTQHCLLLDNRYIAAADLSCTFLHLQLFWSWYAYALNALTPFIWHQMFQLGLITQLSERILLQEPLRDTESEEQGSKRCRYTFMTTP